MADELRGPCEEAFCEEAFADDRLGRYVAAELSEAERDAFEIHVLECAACRAALEASLDIVDAVRAGAAVPIPAASPPVDVSAPLPRLGHDAAEAATSPNPNVKDQAQRAVQPARYGSGTGRRLFRPAFAAAVVIGAVLGWLGRGPWITERERLQASIRQLQEQITQSEIRDREAQTELEQERGLRQQFESAATRLARGIVSFALSPDLERRSGRIQSLAVHRDAIDVRFELDLQAVGKYARYGVELRGPRHDAIWSASGLRAAKAAGVLAIRVPAEVLDSGEHELVLRGITSQGRVDEAAIYYFSIKRT